MTDQPSPSPDVPADSSPPRPRRRWLRLILLIGGGVILALFVTIQFIPVNRADPPVQTPIAWDSPQTQALAQRACMDCHSNETVWPWYSYVAPASWLVYYDVMRGRAQLDFSVNGGRGEGDRFAQQNDLAYRLGAMLAGQASGRGRGDFGGGEGFRPPSGQVPQPGSGQTPPANNGQFPSGEFGGGEGGRFAEQILSGRMPPSNYTMLHPNAVLTDTERQQLIQGLNATFQGRSGG